MPGRTILLAKHSQPVIDPTTSPTTWKLSTPGRRRALALAASLEGRGPSKVFSSPEPKALETAEIVATVLRLDVEVIDDLREHARPALPFADTREAFERAIGDAFARPGETLFGGESVDLARVRFAAAVERLLTSPRAGTRLLVTHGTVLAAFAAHVAGLDPAPLWRRLDLPSWIALDLDARTIVDSWRVARTESAESPATS